MVAAGLLGEVEALLAQGWRDALTARQAIGYKELVPVIENGASLDDAVAAIKQAPDATRSANSRGFARTSGFDG